MANDNVTINGRIITDPILKESGDDWYNDLLNTIYDDEVRQMFRKYKGIPIPQNLIVMGTVNMDETTFSFSRKVLHPLDKILRRGI